MKKLLALVLVSLLFVPTAYVQSPMDYSSLSFPELVALSEQLESAIWQCREWNKILVPQGVYKIGDIIPSGTYIIAMEIGNTLTFDYGDVLSDHGYNISPKGKIYGYFYPDSKTPVGLSDGLYISVGYNKATLIPQKLQGGFDFSMRTTENPYSKYSYEDLLDLKSAVLDQIRSHPLFQQSIVACGRCYQVGIDIPEGHWQITATEDLVNITVGEYAKGSPGKYYITGPSSSQFWYALQKEGESVNVYLHQGDFVEIGWGDVIFSTYAGDYDFEYIN